MYLRKSTASQARSLGAFVDSTDGVTPETGLTIANTDIKLMKNGAASVNKNSGGGTHRANGHYGVTFDATDTDTVGELEVSVVVAGAAPVFKTFFVLEQAVYDYLFATGSGTIDGKTLTAMFATMAAALFGKTSGMATSTGVVRSINDARNAISATQDADGNRSAVTVIDP